MNSLKLVVISSIACLILTSCGGGDGGSNDDGNSNSNTGTNNTPQESKGLTNKVELGPVKGSNVVITTLDGNYNLYSTTTDSNGTYKVDPEVLEKSINDLLGKMPPFLLVAATGGYDIDPNDDGVQEPGEELPLLGTVKGVISSSTLLTEENLSINLISTVISELVRDDDLLTQEKLSVLSHRLGVPDVNNDGKINNKDILSYRMSEHESGIEQTLRSEVLDHIHNNNQYYINGYVSKLESEKGVTTTGHSVYDGIAYIKLNPNSFSNLIYYAVNANSLSEVNQSYSDSITLRKNDYLIFKECVDEDRCSAPQILAFDGKVVRPYLIVSKDNVFRNDLSMMNYFRSEINKYANHVRGLELELESLKAEKEMLENERDENSGLLSALEGY